MKLIYFVLIVAMVSCNQNSQPKDDNPVVATIQAKQNVPEDSITVKIRAAITTIEKQELLQTSVIRSIAIDSILHEMISLRSFYQIKKEELSKSRKLSTDKVKTEKALAYLDKMIAHSSAKPDTYKIQFHLNALLANTTLYNERHTKYLREDLSEIKIVFP